MSFDSYFIVSVPFVKGADQQVSSQFDYLRKQMGETEKALRLFLIPSLKVGTLDSLMEASDELAKLDPQLEGLVLKQLSILEEITKKSRNSIGVIRVTNLQQEMQLDTYLKSFGWNAAQFDTKETVRALIGKLTQVVTGSEERIRSALQEFSETRQKVAAVERKGQGSLAVRPIGEFVSKWCAAQKLIAPVDTALLSTLFVAVPNSTQKEWLSTYWQMDEFVCPKSNSVVSEDVEFTLNAVVMFKKTSDNFKVACRKLKCIVRELDPVDELTGVDVGQLKASQVAQSGSLSSLLSQQFSQCYVAWIHVKALRVFVESMLKYGLPPKFVPVLLAVDSKKEQAIRSKINQLYSDLKTPLSYDENSLDTGALQLEHAYVSIKIANIIKPT